MAHTPRTEVLIAGAGPIGLTAAPAADGVAHGFEGEHIPIRGRRLR